MNCKPGDLVVFVRCFWPENVGKLARVVNRYRCNPDEWRIETLGVFRASGGRMIQPGELVWADDKDMRPIRDPGEDATDETLAWKPVPATTPAMPDREVEHG